MSEFRRNLLKNGGGRMTIPKLPQWAQECIVAWYCPRYQNATNTSLSKDPRLVDLSGNKNDMTIVNQPTNGYILIGQGLNLYSSYAETNGKIKALTDFTIVFHVENIHSTSKYPTLFKKGDAMRLWNWGGWTYVSFGKTNNSDGKPWRHNIPDVGYLTPCSVWGYDVSRGTGADTEGLFRIGDPGFAFGAGTVYSVMLFDRSLTETEINYITDNYL